MGVRRPKSYLSSSEEKLKNGKRPKAKSRKLRSPQRTPNKRRDLFNKKPGNLKNFLTRATCFFSLFSKIFSAKERGNE